MLRTIRSGCLAAAACLWVAGCASTPEPGVQIKTGPGTASYHQAYKQIHQRIASIEQPPEAFTVAVVDMKNATRRGRLVLGSEPRVMLEGELQRTGWFRIIDLPAVSDASEALDAGAAARRKLQELRSAFRYDYLLDGKVVLLASRERINETMWKSSKAVTADAEVELFLREPGSGEIVHNAHGIGEWTETFTQQSGIGIVDPQFEQKTLRLAVNDAVVGLVESLHRAGEITQIREPVTMDDAASALVKDMVRTFPASGKDWRVAVLEIRDWENEKPSTGSELVRKIVEDQLGKEGLTVLTRDNLKDLQLENRFNTYKEMVQTPGGFKPFTFQGAEIIIRGNMGESRLFLEVIDPEGAYLFQGMKHVDL